MSTMEPDEGRQSDAPGRQGSEAEETDTLRWEEATDADDPDSENP
jgi:hypothetical protein